MAFASIRDSMTMISGSERHQDRGTTRMRRGEERASGQSRAGWVANSGEIRRAAAPGQTQSRKMINIPSVSKVYRGLL
jgi:hypothetical protein